jgi:hypothetical protein
MLGRFVKPACRHAPQQEEEGGRFSSRSLVISSGKRVHVSNIQPLAPSIEQGIRGAGVAHSCCASGSQGTANRLKSIGGTGLFREADSPGVVNSLWIINTGETHDDEV